MKRFLFDCIVDKQNICGMQQELAEIEQIIEHQHNAVIYGRRNVGKTSLIKSVVIPAFKKKHKKALCVFVDLMGVNSLEDVYKKIINGFEHSFRASHPVETLFKNFGDSLKSLKPEISYDAWNNSPSVTFNLDLEHHKGVSDIMAHLLAYAQKHPVLLVLDEFQAVAKIPDAQEALRSYFQAFEAIPIIVMGSMKHLLSEMFANPSAPLANFGYDVQIQDIDYGLYCKYMNERFKKTGLKISLDTATYLQDLMKRIPEAINMLCFELQQFLKNQNIEKTDVNEAVLQLLYKRQSRFQYFVANLSPAEKKILKNIADLGSLEKPTSKSFVAHSNLSPRTLSLNVTRLYDAGILEKNERGYGIADPLLNYYILSKKYL